MTPPLHVKVIGSLNCIVLGTLGIRNIVAPGAAVPFIPKDGAFQRHIWAGLEAAELSPGQVTFSNIMGISLLTVVASKLTTLFSAKEGTLLRRNLLMVYGLMDCFMAMRALSYEKEFHAAGATTKGLSFFMLLEGATFLYDAIFRERKIKSQPNDGPQKQ